MTAPSWLVELLLPSGEFQVRKCSQQSSADQLRKQVRESVTMLVSAPVAAAGAAVQQQQQQQQQQSPQASGPAAKELLMAYAGTREEAAAAAEDLRMMFGRTPLPWSEGAQRDLETYLECRLRLFDERDHTALHHVSDMGENARREAKAAPKGCE
jgi:hypothetical protein